MGSKTRNQDHTYTLQVTGRQLAVIEKAVEEYFRLSLNQWRDLADRLTGSCFDLSKVHPDHDGEFYRYVQTRNKVHDMLREAGNILCNTNLPDKSSEEMTAVDIWHAIRHFRYLESGNIDKWRVDSYPPHPESDEPLPKLSVCEKE